MSIVLSSDKFNLSIFILFAPQEVEDKDSLLSISSDSDLVRFLFYKEDSGLNLSTLVSVPHSNWFISTAKENNKPVEMCLESAQRHKTFKIQRQS